MKKVGLIGLGYWGKILYSKLEKFCDIKFACKSKDTYIDKLKNVEWVVVSTPDNTHYEIVKNCLEAHKNVFCEKPLTLTYSQSKKLFRLAEMKGVKLYVDDIQNYRDYNFEIRDYNLVEREKAGRGNIQDILYMLAYHDIYLLHEYIKDLEIEKVILIDNDNKLHFKVKFDKMVVEFLYNLNSKEKKHYINGYNLRSDSDILSKMLSNVLSENANFNYNKEISLFANKFIDLLNEKIFMGESNSNIC